MSILIFSHPILPVILSRFFNLILCTRYVPVGFKRSYIVPIPKLSDVRTKVRKWHATILEASLSVP